MINILYNSSIKNMDYTNKHGYNYNYKSWNKKYKKYKTNNKVSSNKSYSKDRESLHSINSHREKKYDTIPFRLEFIKNLLSGNKLNPLIDISNCDTEYYVNPCGYKSYDSENDDYKSDDQNTDIRYLLDKKLLNFYKIIDQIGGKLLYIKSGTTGHTFKGMINIEDGSHINYAVKVVAYPKRGRYGDMNNANRPENAELMMIRLLSYFVVNKQTPHIILPIGTYNTSIKPFVNLIKDKVIDKCNSKYMNFIKKYNKNEYYDYVSILISEWANKGDLLDFIRKNYREFSAITWKVLFFQIISALAVIQSKFPSFRHNDLKANNILIHKIKKRSVSYVYTVNKCKYVIPNIGYQIKLWDFDFACIPGIVNNAKVSAKWTDIINVRPEKNKYYDMHYFFNTLIKKGFFYQFMTDSCIPKDAKEFVNRVVPFKYQYDKKEKYVSSRGRYLLRTEYTTPDKVLKEDKYFDEFKYHNYKKRRKIKRNKKKLKETKKKRSYKMY